MNNFSIGGIVSLTPATRALLIDIADVLSLPVMMTAQALATTIEQCREISRDLNGPDREILDELLADLEPLADFSAVALPAPAPAPAIQAGEHHNI